MWKRHRYVHRLYASMPRLRRLLMRVMFRSELISLRGHKDRSILDFISRVQRERESLLSAKEGYIVYQMAKAQGRLSGSMAEVGVYQGCSARLISHASGGRRLYLFDTFAGLPVPSIAEQKFLRSKQYSATLADVRSYLGQETDCIFRAGLFPDTTAGLEAERFSFVHLDVDLKTSTRSCLEFFVPRMMPGGIILTHDYSYLDGVREAFEEFTADGGPQVIELPTSQAFLVFPGPGGSILPTTDMVSVSADRGSRLHSQLVPASG